MFRKLALTALVLGASFVPSFAHAQTTLATAHPAVLGQGRYISVGASSQYYLRYQLQANRSYFAVCWNLTTTTQVTTCGVDIRNGSDVSVGSALNVEPFDSTFTTFGGDGDSFQPTTSGSYYVRVANSAGTSITSEIEGKTALTLLSKPIDRRQFLFGKYIGILQAVIWMFLILTAIFALLTFIKVGYDQKEQSLDVTPYWQWIKISDVELPVPHPDRMNVVGAILPGIALTFMQVAVLGAISVTVATRLPMVMNLVICFAVFVVGNLTEIIVNSSVEGQANESVIFTARLISMVVPSLSAFNISSAVATGRIVPQDYLGLSLIYATAYIGAMLLLGFLLFEDRDLA